MELRIDNVSKTYSDGTRAVRNVSLTVSEGLIGLLGPNGAGKSTLINMLVTLLQPTGGTATVDGHDVTEETAAVRNSIGIVFQEQALDEELTGAENLAFHSRLYGQSADEREERIDEILDLVGLDDERDDPVGTYSGGMKRRLEIGRGLLHEPAVLFLDEPTTGLDARTRRDSWEYIRRLNEEAGVSVVLTTHYIEEAEQLCDRVAVVDDGEIAAIDSPDALTASIGGDVVSLELDGSTATLRDRLAAQSWVSEFSAGEGGLRVTVDHGRQRIADLVRLADDAGVPVTAVDVREPNLETAFLSLTGATMAEREADESGHREPEATVGAGGDR